MPAPWSYGAQCRKRQQRGQTVWRHRYSVCGRKRRSHMRNLQEVFSETNGLYGRIDRILKFSTYDEYDDLSGLDIDYRDGEPLFLLDELQSVMEKLDVMRGKLSYLAFPIREVGRLHKKESGRYETDSGHYYTCGSLIEALVQDSYRGPVSFHQGPGAAPAGNRKGVLSDPPGFSIAWILVTIADMRINYSK